MKNLRNWNTRYIYKEYIKNINMVSKILNEYIFAYF